MAAARNIPAGMHFNIQRVVHYEGMPDPGQSGFATSYAASLPPGGDPLSIVAQIQADNIFGNFDSKREMLYNEMYKVMQPGAYQNSAMPFETRLKGDSWWDTTLFPGIKELVSYGANYIADNSLTDTASKVVSDAVALAISIAAPDLMPAIIAAQEVGQKGLKSAMDFGVDGLKKWADSGRI